MEIRVILLLLLAAIIHSTWNTLAKRSNDKQVFFWLSLCVTGVIYFIPFCFYYRPISAQGWVYIVLSGTLEAIYFFFLGTAYRFGEVSQVYPLARGSSPLFVILIARCFLGEIISAQGLIGVALILAGINFVYIDSAGRFDFRSLKAKGAFFALLTGITTACYSVVDKVGISLVDPVLYVYLLFIVTCGVMGFSMPGKWELVKKEVSLNKGPIAFVGIFQVISYLLVLFALDMSKVSYVSPVREMSIVIAPIFGAVFLKERLTRGKIGGSVLIFFGIVLIALAK